MGWEVDEVVPITCLFSNPWELLLRLLILLCYASRRGLGLSVTYALDEYLLFACLFAIEYPECAACYFESLGFTDHQQGK